MAGNILNIYQKSELVRLPPNVQKQVGTVASRLDGFKLSENARSRDIAEWRGIVDIFRKRLVFTAHMESANDLTRIVELRPSLIGGETSIFPAGMAKRLIQLGENEKSYSYPIGSYDLNSLNVPDYVVSRFKEFRNGQIKKIPVPVGAYKAAVAILNKWVEAAENFYFFSGGIDSFKHNVIWEITNAASAATFEGIKSTIKMVDELLGQVKQNSD